MDMPARGQEPGGRGFGSYQSIRGVRGSTPDG